MKNTNTYRTLKQRNTLFTWFILTTSFMFFIPSLMMDRIWLDLKSIQVQEINYEGDDVFLHIERVIHRNFTGEYFVNIRSVEGNFICQARSDGVFVYRKDAVLPDHVDIAWWLGSHKKLDECVENGFTTGTFRINTCQKVVDSLWHIPIAQRCVESNLFTIVKRI